MIASSKLGRTGLEVSRLGFGTWQIGGGRWQAPERQECVGMLRAAAERGVNLFDAAYVYGQYRSHEAILQSRALELLGEAFGKSELGRSTFVCLKLGQLDEFSHSADYTPRRMVENFRHALALLRRETVDICLVHAPSLVEVEQGRALAVLETLKGLGLARAIGYSFENEPQHVSAALRQPVDVLMLQYNLIDTLCGAVLNDAWRNGVGVLVGGPYKRGYLSGRYREVADLPLNDDYWQWNVRLNLSRVTTTLHQVVSLLDEAGSAAELRRRALKFILDTPPAPCVVVGHRSLSEVEDNIATIDQVLQAASQP